MAEPYDCTADVLKHKQLVLTHMMEFGLALFARARIHDDSKLQSPEKEMFDEWTPELKVRTFGTEYYKEALNAMGPGIRHHYANNDHHPEHYENGVDGMTLLALIEMFCDWRAAAEGKGVPLDLDAAQARFNLSPQLVSIFKNSLQIPNSLNAQSAQETAHE